MYEVVKRNLRKRKKFVDTWYIETTTMFAPGANSVAESTYGEAEALREGRKRLGRHRLLYDHRWGECSDLRNVEELRAAIVDALGEAMEWNDLDGLIDEFYDTRSKPESSRRYFLNAQTSTSDAWIAAHELDACKRPDLQLRPGDMVTLGLDGSVSDDATALVAVRVADGHAELLAVFEKPEGPEGEGWQVDRAAVDAAVASAMHTFQVVGFFCDPAHWQDSLDRWSNEWGAKMRVRATERRPLEWWCNRPRAMVAALERLHEAILERRVTFTPAEDRTGVPAQLALTLRRHLLNARRRPSRAGMQIGKEYPHSPRKIDAAMALTLAWECRNDAIAAGVQSAGDAFYMPKRLR
jgi:hypothetical protein